MNEDYEEEIESEEDAYERWLEDYYGGSQPVTIKEQQEQAKRIK